MKKNVTLSMNETFLTVVDEVRAKYGLSRSEFLRQSVMSRMKELNEVVK